MIRLKVVNCDVCKKEIARFDTRYTFRNRHFCYPCDNYWQKMDMCEDCFELFKQWSALAQGKAKE